MTRALSFAISVFAISMVAMLCGTVSWAQDAIPPGTILPVELNTSLRSDKMHSGALVRGRIMQDVPLPGGAKIRSGMQVIGTVIDVAEGSQPEVALRFDALRTGNRQIPLTTNLRALATAMDVQQAKIPDSGPDRGTSEASWVTEQIGGETVYHGSIVTHGSQVVGKYVGGGVLVRVSGRPGTSCRGGLEADDRPQALWVFSSDACGLYDLPHLQLEHAGRTSPVGEIRLRSIKGPVKVPAGSGLLLRVLVQRN